MMTQPAVSSDWIVQCFTSPPTQYRLYGRRFFSGQKTQPTVSTEGDAIAGEELVGIVHLVTPS